MNTTSEASLSSASKTPSNNLSNNPSDSDVAQAAASLRAAIQSACVGLIDREVVVEVIALAAVASEHVLVIGPPGTAKSEAVRRMASALSGQYFEYLLGRFTEPSEIFGPVNLQKLKEGIVETATDGMLPEAEIAFLDEIFLGSTAILNTLLGLLNERVFRRGHTVLRCPLRVCVGASNALPSDAALAAFADRFLLRLFVEPVSDPMLEDLLLGGRSVERRPQTAVSNMQMLDVLMQTARNMDTSPIVPSLAQCIRLLRKAGINLSDRRAVKLQRVIAAATALAGRTTPTDADLWPLIYAVPTADGQNAAREVLANVLAASESTTLAGAALDASLGPKARAVTLGAMADRLLGEEPENRAERLMWMLKLEGVARDIDAGFTKENLPPALVEVRTRLVERIQALEAETTTK